MLRVMVLALVLLNLVYLAWGQGWLLPYGIGPVSQREPQRLAMQIRPQAIELLTAKEAEQLLLASATPPPLPCWQAGLFDEAQMLSLSESLTANLPESAWSFEQVTKPERWIVYIGKFANLAELKKKRAQIADLNLTLVPLINPDLAPGLCLGVFKSEELADTALIVLNHRGVRTARVVQEYPSLTGYRLLLPSVDETLQHLLVSVKPALAGKAMMPCQSTQNNY